ncbi:DUF805 domain-containing protein [Kordia sp. YSTF-M3]|uniref:DUF805 domain-containing protein n=1 Tax=Kordia aestuariivivens TaxID=2759037 RepID=A0ABR7Q4Z3_9FLAO|nr:DUF805 domain-containing protein [Kordia aestuariivivens]MBC8753620.1 DUF805 domain-containing protein [Kordia aestuariivivens]
MEWYLKVVRDNFANFEGRARRQEYWMFILFNIIILIGLVMTFGILTAITQSPAIGILGFSVYIIYGLGILIPNLAVIVRRLHDTGNSGWMILIQLIPLVGGIWLLVLMCTEGQVGPNEYGPDPKAAYPDDLNTIGPRSNN